MMPWRGVLAAALSLSVIACATPQAPTPASPGTSQFVDVPGIGATRADVPRPSGPAPATCTPLAPGPADGQTTVQRVAALRTLGFFTDRLDSDAAIAAAIDDEATAEFGAAPRPTDPMTELTTAAADDAHVWWRDLEADVDESNKVYEGAVEEWAAISRGAFAPTAIEERWASPTGPVTVAFTLNGTRHELHPAYLEDWIDPTILEPINALIASSGRQFEAYRAFDQTLFVVALTTAEKRALERERGWCFEWPSPG
ncbi:MAG TPA: hypothetical protein VGC90_05830 [Candidatus Limnocylindrales bacterium]